MHSIYRSDLSDQRVKEGLSNTQDGKNGHVNEKN